MASPLSGSPRSRTPGALAGPGLAVFFRNVRYRAVTGQRFPSVVSCEVTHRGGDPFQRSLPTEQGEDLENPWTGRPTGQCNAKGRKELPGAESPSLGERPERRFKWLRSPRRNGRESVASRG